MRPPQESTARRAAALGVVDALDVGSLIVVVAVVDELPIEPDPVVVMTIGLVSVMVLVGKLMLPVTEPPPVVVGKNVLISVPLTIDVKGGVPSVKLPQRSLTLL